MVNSDNFAASCNITYCTDQSAHPALMTSLAAERLSNEIIQTTKTFGFGGGGNHGAKFHFDTLDELFALVCL
jgi:hypothetical protein